jgi:heme/copper-type cytochrome/quinol oxidase subunit 2
MVVLLFIAVPSVSLLYALEEFMVSTAALAIQVVGRQWYWVYEYPSFAVNLLEVEPLETEAELRDPQDSRFRRMGLRLLDSTPLLLPIALEVEFLTASEDVIHSFALPSAGLKMDAVPGRLNLAISNFLREGVIYGQCSELCGSGHGFMPITAYITGVANFQLHLLEHAGLMKDYLQQWVAEAPEEPRNRKPIVRCESLEELMAREFHCPTAREQAELVAQLVQETLLLMETHKPTARGAEEWLQQLREQLTKRITQHYPRLTNQKVAELAEKAAREIFRRYCGDAASDFLLEQERAVERFKAEYLAMMQEVAPMVQEINTPEATEVHKAAKVRGIMGRDGCLYTESQYLQTMEFLKDSFMSDEAWERMEKAARSKGGAQAEAEYEERARIRRSHRPKK